jgi:LuxR family transcriptional regulator, maltose regulon positive regulatory protein
MTAPDHARKLAPQVEPINESSMVKPTLLSAREAEVLRSCSRGLSNQEIGDQLAITVGTTKGHLFRIFRKLNVRNRTGAVARAREMGLLK